MLRASFSGQWKKVCYVFVVGKREGEEEMVPLLGSRSPFLHQISQPGSDLVMKLFLPGPKGPF